MAVEAVSPTMGVGEAVSYFGRIALELTWCGVPSTTDGKWRGNTGATVTRSDICIVGIPYDGGRSATGGQDAAPFAIRRLEYVDSWRDHRVGDLATVKVVDAGDLDIDARSAAESLRYHDKFVGKLLPNTDLLLTLGGDHSITSWLIEQFHIKTGAPIGVIHLDAHADTWPDEDPYNTNLPSHASWVSWSMDKKHIRHIWQLGVRALGPDAMADGYLTNRSVSKGGYTWEDAKKLSTHIRREYPDMPIYLSIDMDVVDPAHCPGVAYPEPGGWLPQTLFHLVETFVSELPVLGVDIVEITPSLDIANQSVRLGHRTVLSALRGVKRRAGK